MGGDAEPRMLAGEGVAYMSPGLREEISPLSGAVGASGMTDSLDPSSFGLVSKGSGLVAVTGSLA